MKHQSLRISDRERMAIRPDGSKIPVVDGKFDFLVSPNDDDIQNGIMGDHENCMYCRACRRQFGSELVWITRGLAYVEVAVRGGKKQLQRFILKDPARVNVKGFDDNKNVTPEAVIFAAPKGSKTLDAKRKIQARYRAKRARIAYLKGEISASRGKHPRKTPQPFFAALRSKATGMFNFHGVRKTTLLPQECTEE